MDSYEILKKVSTGELSPEDGAVLLKQQEYSDLGFAKIDTDRKHRTGAAEIIYCEGKEDEHLACIYRSMMDEYGEVLGTRASDSQYIAVKASVPEILYDSVSKILKYEKQGKEKKGLVAVCAAGTADISVAEEASQTAEFLGCNISRFYDVGVSGIHRLLSNIDKIRAANCVIAVAGMEGALASVIGGLVSCPVIAVPTSVGYGASFGGLSALLTMINSCANGIAVVNIDNGFGAGFIASQINRLAVR